MTTTSALQRSADAWARARGFAGAAHIPREQRDAAVAAVAADQGVAAADVRAALVAVWSSDNDARGRGLDAFGGAAGYRGGTVHTPVARSPLGVRLAASARRPPVVDDRAREAGHLVSQRLRRELKAALGEAGAALADVPSRLFAGDVPDDVGALLHAVATAPTTSLATKNEMLARRAALDEALREVKKLRPDEVARHGLAWNRRLARVNDILLPLLEAAARDAGVFMKAVPKAPHDGGDAGFCVFRAMRSAERKLEELRATDPDAWAVAVRRKEAFAEWERGVAGACAEQGLTAKKTRLLGALVTIGTDPRTGEETVFSPQHGALPVDAFVTARKQELAEKKALAAQDIPLSAVERCPVDVAALPGEPRWASLTDDTAKDDGLTRIYAVKTHVDKAGVGRDVVVEGRFAGCYLDALVNEAGRLVEGRAHKYHPVLLRGRAGALPPPRPDVAEREPYVTVARVQERGETREKLFVQLPNMRDEWTEVRQAMRKLSERVPSIRYVEGSRNTAFTFEPKDFQVVRDALGGMALSTGALAEVKAWFTGLAEAERAASAESLEAYAPAAIGGFKKSVRTSRGASVDVDLHVHQRKALAWLEANGGNGVISLDTGMGKTLTAIAAMQKLIRDEPASSHGTAQRFLFVCPPALRGNLAKEIHRFLDKKAAHDLLARLDVVSYGEFRAAAKSGKLRGAAPFSPERYAAVFFDEAQALKNPDNETTRAALAFDHPKKVCLTASPMEKNPMEAYVLSCVAHNVDLADKVAGKEHRREMRKWRERFCETFGGRIVGVVDDELTRADLHTWVKRNVFFADKRETAAFDLPPLEERAEVVPMSRELEGAYRDAARDLEKAMRGMVTLFRDKGLVDGKPDKLARDKKIAGMLGLTLRPLMKRLDDLQNVPERVVAGAGAPKIERAASVVKGRLRETDGASRTVLFSDDEGMVKESARALSAQIPGKVHAACLGGEIRLYKNGEELSTYAGFALPFTPKPYRRDLGAAPHPVHNRHHKKNQWQQFVLGELLGPDAEVTTCTLLGQVYQTGQNLQAFDTCIHLDRDSWNAEDMRQRTARVWRQGQEDPVVEVTIDMVYDAPHDDRDETLDRIRAHHQLLEGALFDDVIRAAQHKELGREWSEMDATSTSTLALDRLTLELLASPFVSRGKLSGDDDGDAAHAP